MKLTDEVVKAMLQVASSLCGVVVGFLLALIKSHFDRLSSEGKEKRRILHSFYFELEENIIYVANLKFPKLDLTLRPLQLDSYATLKASAICSDLRGPKLQAICNYGILTMDVNQRIAAIKGLIPEELVEQIGWLRKSMEKLQGEMADYLIKEKALKVQNAEGTG